LFQALEALDLALGFGERSRSLGPRTWEGFQAHASDVEVLFKTVWLEEVGEFESAEKT